MRLLPLAFLVLACSDYDINPHGKDAGAGDDTGPGGGPDTDDTDVGGGDTDEDGECDPPDLSGREVSVDDACESVPTVGTFTPVIKWTNRDVGDGYTTPAVGQLTDDNGDGMITNADIPDIAYANGAGVLFALSGDDGHILWRVPGFGSEPMSPAIGDLDNDGFPEVVAAGATMTEAVHGTDGSVMWNAAAYAGNVAAACGAVGIYDLNADGDPEVVIGRWIINGQTGATLGNGNAGDGSGHGWAAPISAAADIDGDGRLEVVVGNALYDRTGRAKWNNGQTDGYPAVANFDSDPYGEIVVTSVGDLRLQDDDGTVLWTKRGLLGATSGPPTVADYDGDGEPEIGVAGNGRYMVVEGDGSVKWTRSTQDYSSGFTGSAVFDFEGDGAAEVVYADENDLFVFDGATGEIKLQESQHSSATCSEYPSIADVDNDGHAEIIYSSSAYSGTESGITVVGDADNSWQPGRPVWNQHAYSITNVEDDGGIPTVTATNWLTYNSFRSGDLSSATGGALTDAVVLLSEICNVECDDGLLRVTVVLGNSGAGELPVGTNVSLYVYQSGVPVFVETQTVTDAVASGESSGGLVFSIDPSIVTDDLIEFRADDAAGTGAIAECDETNNILEVNDMLCP